MKIIFMGSSRFAYPALSRLTYSNNEIVGVYTKATDCKAKNVETQNTIQDIIKKLSLTTFTPTSLKRSEVLSQFKKLQPDIAVVVAYGLIIPRSLMMLPKFGFINLHPSNLPRWRGAAPIQRAIMQGDKKTAVCIMQMNEGLDTGDIIIKKEIDIHYEMTAKKLHDICSKIGAAMILKAIKLFELNRVCYIAQGDNILYANKITAQDKILNFNSSADEINNQIRSLSPKPGAHFMYQNKMIKIIHAIVIKNRQKHRPGLVIDNDLGIAFNKDIVRPTLLQREGKKVTKREEFLRGFSIPLGVTLNSANNL